MVLVFVVLMVFFLRCMPLCFGGAAFFWEVDFILWTLRGKICGIWVDFSVGIAGGEALWIQNLQILQNIFDVEVSLFIMYTNDP